MLSPESWTADKPCTPHKKRFKILILKKRILEKMFKLSKEGIEFVKKEMSRYETKLSAVIPCLYRVQTENNGWISPESVSYLSDLMKLEEAKIYEALTFYTMFNKQPVGKFHIQVCCNITCAMKGSRRLFKKLKTKFQESENSLCTVTPVECLGSCDTAPVLQINREPYVENTSFEKAEKLILSKIENSKKQKTALV